jgi:type I restriction enzyme S subunit
MVALAEVAEISGGITKNAKRSALPIQRPYLSVANVHFNRIDTNNLSNIGVNETEIARVQLIPGDLMVVEGNGSLSQLGRVAIWHGQVSGCLHQNHLIKVRPKPTVKSKWLLYWLMSSSGREAIEATASSTSGLHTLSLSKVGSLPAPIATLEEQEAAIAYIDLHLSRLDETVTTLQGIQAKLKQARASILKAAVEGRLVERAINNKQRFPVLSVGDICSTKPTNGRSVPTLDGGFPVLRLTAMKGGQIDFAEMKGGVWSEEEAAKWIIEEGDFFVMRGNGSIKRVGDGAIAKQVPCKVAYPDTMIRIRADPERLDSRYLLHLWRSPLLRSQIESAAKTTAGIFKINQRDIATFRLPIPTLGEQREIVAEVDRRFSVLDQVEAAATASLSRCSKLRQAILKQAFEGRLVQTA